MCFRIRSALVAITAGILLGSGASLAASNACKADLNGDLVVNFADLAVLKSVFFQRCTDPPPGPSQAFAATGQTTCWNSGGVVVSCTGTGHDGEIQAGATLAYVDNGDGTITDVNTGLMWEKLSDDGTIHDWDDRYTWDDAFAVKIATLNGGGGFAGHGDWRVPNIKELQSIVNYQNGNPAVSPVFHNGCTPGCSVTTCSCTQLSDAGYWSSSTHASYPYAAWFVLFGYGYVSADTKTDIAYVRAVRGGL